MASTEGPTDSGTMLQRAAGAWQLDPARTTIRLHTKAMWGLAKVTATFAVERGQGTVGPDGSLEGTMVIDAASVDTGNKRRDTHLRTADFLEVDAHPAITYTATGATASPDGRVVVDGSLEVHGTTRPFQVPVTVQELGPTSATVHAEVDLDRRDWDVSWARMGARTDNHIAITATFTRT